MNTGWPARSVWLGGGPETIAESLTTRIRDPIVTFPDVEAFLAALEGSVHHHFSYGPSMGMEKFLEGVVKFLGSLDADISFPVPLKIQIIVIQGDFDMNTGNPIFDVQLRVSSECGEVLRTYNRLRDLRVQEVLYRQVGPVKVREEAGVFQVDLFLSNGWDDDPLSFFP